MSRLAVSACLVLAPLGGAEAQTTQRLDQGRIRLGPLRFTPSIALTNVGIDNNVFNDDVNPKQDTVAIVGPAADWWLKIGPSRLSGRTIGQYQYFDRYESQRMWNVGNEGKWEILGGRLTPFVEGTYANLRDRPNYEIDARVQRRNESMSVGSALRLSSRTNIVASAHRARLGFADNATFRARNLASALNHTTDFAHVEVRHELTSLTTFVANAEAVQDRFWSDALRDADSIRVLPGFEMKPSALVGGSVFVGYRRFTPRNEAVPRYSGVIASVDARYNVWATQLAVRVDRDLAYSVSELEPYYGLTNVGLRVTQRITRSWDVVGNGGWQWLQYHHLLSNPLAFERTDRTGQYGTGLGYRVGRTFRLGFDATYFERRSQIIGPSYKALRAGASLTYGSLQ